MAREFSVQHVGREAIELVRQLCGFERAEMAGAATALNPAKDVRNPALGGALAAVPAGSELDALQQAADDLERLVRLVVQRPDA
ncbi:serine/threonine-protein phosphatase 2A regulatory subunit B'' subunit alpha [Ralstonia phage RPZH3]|nr:serine/threonine-protein phosphatase 2A regulatory subunit B'' subunit alpha [Ralstonia phage RPZH3]